MPTRGAAAAAAASIIWKHRQNLSLRPLSNHFNPNFNPCIIPTGFKCQVREIQRASNDSVTPLKNRDEQKPQNWKIKLLYDGDCPLCMCQVNMLMERNEGFGTIKFVDISSNDYSTEDNQGLDYRTVMGQIHAIQSDGTVVVGVKAFRRLYEEVGLGWVYTITKFEPIGKIADAVYDVWAKFRLQVTGRPSLEAIPEARKKYKVETCGESKSCKM